MAWSSLSINAPAGNADSILSSSDNLLATTVVHPWVEGAGEGNGHYKYLRFPNAVKKLVEENEFNTEAVLAIAVTAASYTDFKTQLSTLNAVFPVKDLQLIERRAAEMVTIEHSKWQLNFTHNNIITTQRNSSALAVLKQLHAAADVDVAINEAQTFKNSNPAANLTAFAARKQTYDTTAASTLANIKTGLSGGAGWRFYAQFDIKNALQTGHPGHDYTLTAIVLFAGSASDLALLNEMLA